jgi:MFS family permease
LRDRLVKALDFFAFFIIIGVMVSSIGVAALFTLKDAPGLKAKQDPKGFWHQFFSVFNYRTVRENKELFWVFVIMMVYFIGFNVYFPYITIYFINYLGMDIGLTGIVQGVSLLAAVLFTIPAAKYIDTGKNTFVIRVALIFNIAGLVTVSFSHVIITLGLGMLLTAIGYVIILQTLTAWFKNLYPVDQRGQFEGIKQLFFVCIPMIIGPTISNIVISNFGVEGVVNGKEGMIPNEVLFAVSAGLTLLTFLPLLPAGKLFIARKKQAGHE